MGAVFFHILLAMAVSLDSFGVGVTYGLRRIRIHWVSILIIGCCSGGVAGLSMQLGRIGAMWIPPSITSGVGATILVFMGLYTLVQVRQSHSSQSNKELTTPVRVFSFELRKFGIVIQILKSPIAADRDDSGVISSGEAVWLGMALSLDAFGVGLGAALLGFSPWMAAGTIALMSVLFLAMGMRIGFRFRGWAFFSAGAYIPGILLIVMGVIRFME
ncbi:putative sporulation protein YtaF [Marininema mesophilum]|uniref:Putative sporulation protein YtaF n=1 Tax=Marininema mesophilum TaxID=1048340 RepID=A0A1H2XSG6_9BACL|nr:sporulation membrane protein YtaF [Marininema mesophilum]SDW95618.1 putative sporulation protein YtaF [Marininema mesophilum]